MSVFNIETLNALGARLFDHAEDISDALEFEPVTSDLRLAARAIDKLAGLRFRIGEIAESCMTQAPAATRGDLLDAAAAL